MRPLIAVLAPFLVGAAARGSEQHDGFAGEWKTTMGPVTFERLGDDVTGKIVFFKLPLKGKSKDRTLTVGYDEGQIQPPSSRAMLPWSRARLSRDRPATC